MTNFDFLTKEPQFHTFAETAVAAEQLLHQDVDLCVLNCRRAMEFAVRWLYSVDADLPQPYSDTLQSLMDAPDFRALVGPDTHKRMVYVRKQGNKAAHVGKRTLDQAKLCLENLFYFMDQLAYFYSADYRQLSFDRQLLEIEEPLSVQIEDAVIPDMQALIAENKTLRGELTALRKVKEGTFRSQGVDISEYETRKQYIDIMLEDANWQKGKNWIDEVPVKGMPNKSGEGFVDYVLYDDRLVPLAIIEAKRTSVDVEKGRQQAKLYADLLEQQYGRRPIIFLSNGFETRIKDGCYPERRVAAIFSKRDLEKIFNLRTTKTSLSNVNINRAIADRYYQEEAVKAVCRALDEENRRKALLVMATGSGKTRTVMALIDVLLQHGWITNVLFLADRNALVRQAKGAFANLLPNLYASNLCETNPDVTARCIFSTYQSMIHYIDDAQDENGERIFTPGHFDLVICDEAHRSIYNKYKDIFTYFDAPLIGLTATPKDDVDKNTYDIFDLATGDPTYGYELDQAVKDGYLVDYMSVETTLKFLQEGITYDDLSEKEKEQYEETFADEEGEMPERIDSSALNEWLFNENTIKQVINIVMKDGLRVDYGEKLGKTIIFAKNHKHAEKIKEVFEKEYPKLIDYVEVIDNHINYAQSLIDQFSDADKLPQIAISVDMLDTGIDIPEILNLVMFKRVMSKAKFWQMIGRGTRLCPGLIDGKPKEKFYIFDFCGNFDFFRMKEAKEATNQIPLQSALFIIEFDLAYTLQGLEYQTEELIAFRQELVDRMVSKVDELERNNFAVRQHIRYVEKYAEPENYNLISYEDTRKIREEVAPLLLPDDDVASAIRFDYLMKRLETGYLLKKPTTKERNDLQKKVRALASVANIPEIRMQSDLLKEIIHTDYLERADIGDFEHIRKSLRDLMVYLPKEYRGIYETNFTDEVLTYEWKEAETSTNDLENYRARAEFYVREHQDNPVIAKLKTNRPLTPRDINELEAILWVDIGSKSEYALAFGEKPLGEFVREIVGLDMNAAKEAFAGFLSNTYLDDRQIYFVNQIIEYIVHNGMMKDFSVLQDPPFTDRGSIYDVFPDHSVWNDVKAIIDQINANAAA